jgi:putative hydrolase of the HAD superfamily
MRAVLVPHSAIPAHQQVGTDAVPDAIVSRLSDLVGVVDRWLDG